MKLRYAIFAAFLPILLGASLPVGVEDPDYGCDFTKNYCVIKADALHELVEGTRARCDTGIKA